MNDEFTPPPNSDGESPKDVHVNIPSGRPLDVGGFTSSPLDVEMVTIDLSSNIEGVIQGPPILGDTTTANLSNSQSDKPKFPGLLIAAGEKTDDQIRWCYYPIFTVLVTLVDIALMIWPLVIGGFTSPTSNAMLGPPAQTLLDVGAKWTPYIVNNGQWWRLVSASYLHAGLVHLLTNMIMQVSLGWILERKYGTVKLAVIYVFSGIGGILTSAIFIPEMLTVGASGALMGVIGMWVVDVCTNLKMIYRPWLSLLFIVVSLLITFGLGLLPFVDNFAHLGGFIFGLELSIVLLPPFKSQVVWKKRLRWVLFFVFLSIFLLNAIGFFQTF